MNTHLARPVASRFDVALASALLIACEIEVALDLRNDHGHDHWPLAANIAVAAGLTVPLLWRRRAPLASLVIVKSSVLLLIVGMADVRSVNFPQLLLFIAPYSVAAYASRRRALLGLAYDGAMIVTANLLVPSGASSWVFASSAAIGSWATGRMIRARRSLAEELRLTTERIAVEREGHELLAIAEQRTRIAHELQSLVADSVSVMIVQTEAAQRLLEQDPGLADEAMATIEATGRQALEEMRRILGVLRRQGEDVALAPQPGVGQVPGLVERARQSLAQLTLQVDGEPGPLPTSVDLALYRILEEALATIGAVSRPTQVALRFDTDDVELGVTVVGGAQLAWPTTAMRERAALCEGTVDVEVVPDVGERLVARLPRTFQGALA